MQIIFVRHCQTDWNVQGLMQGQKDIPLNDTGRLQARELAEKLRGFKLKQIIASDLSRARETAEIIGEGHGLTPRLDARLRECGFGSLEGLPKPEIYLQQEDPKLAYPYDYKKFGGETTRDVLARQIELLNELPDLATDEHILFVGHGRAIRTLMIGLGRDQQAMTHGELIILPHQEVLQALPTLLEKDFPNVFLD